MKKHLKKLLLLPLVAMTMLFSGCGPEVELRTTYFTVNPGDWQRMVADVVDGDEYGYAYAECAFPELTQNVIDGGAVMVYYIDAAGFDNQLPYLLPYYDNGNGPYFENIRYDLQPGCITFIVQQNDNIVLTPSVKMAFKVCVFQNR